MGRQIRWEWVVGGAVLGAVVGHVVAKKPTEGAIGGAVLGGIFSMVPPVVAPPIEQPPSGELGLSLEVVGSPRSPALVRATIRVRATAGTTPISADGTLVVPAIGRSITWHVDILELGVWYEVVDQFDVPPGVTITVTVSGTLTNPYGTYDLPSVSKTITVPGEPPVGELDLVVALV